MVRFARSDGEGFNVQKPTELAELPVDATRIAGVPAVLVVDTGDGPRACLTGARLSLPPK